MIVLSMDTALDACSAALVSGDEILAARAEPCRRGQVERLPVLIQEVREEAGLSFASLERIAVTVGPGSFTGIRIGLAMARGMALASGVPIVGVTTLEAFALKHQEHRMANVVAAIDTGRGSFYLQPFAAGGIPVSDPRLSADEEVRDLIGSWKGGAAIDICGPGRERICAILNIESEERNPPGEEIIDPGTLAHIGCNRPVPEDGRAPEPLYLRSHYATPDDSQ